MDDKWYESEELKPDLDEDLLMHYGVKGMKWRNHKYRTKGGSGRKRKGPYDPSIPMVDEDMRSPLEQVFSKYTRWFNSTKFGKFYNTPINQLYGKGKAEAAENEKGNRKYMDYYDGQGNLVRREKQYYYGARRRRTNRG